ncbi:MAG TPA: nuclear transport factor 2 family protein [Gemmatimonadaceae bacterium]
MKWSRVLATLLTLAIVACAVQEKKPPAESDKAVVNAYVRAWNQHDTIAVDSLLAADAIHEDYAQNFRGRGPKEVVAFMRGVVSAQPDYKLTVTNSIEDGKFVALEWTWTATYTGLDPTGKRVTNRHTSGKGASFAEVENGKIKRFSDYYDLASFFR